MNEERLDLKKVKKAISQILKSLHWELEQPGPQDDQNITFLKTWFLKCKTIEKKKKLHYRQGSCWCWTLMFWIPLGLNELKETVNT